MTQVPAAQDAAAGSRAPASAFDLAWMAGLFAAVLALAFRMNGGSPRIWEDTNIENGFIDDCLHNNHCSTVGQGATVGIFHSAGYFHVRSLLWWLGSDADHTYLLFLVMGAAGVVLVAFTARRAGGLLAAGIASVLMFEFISRQMQFNAITDVAPVPFLGTVFLALAWVAAERPSLWLAALLGLVGAVLADTYAPTVSCLVSAVWVALLHPARRRARVWVTLAAFIIPTLVIAPGGWFISVREVFHHHVLGNIPPVNARRFWQVWPLIATALATGIWGWAGLTRRVALRRRLDVLAAIFVPACIGLFVGDVTKFVGAQEKYAAHVVGAVAVGLAVPAANLIRRAIVWFGQGRRYYLAGAALVILGLWGSSWARSMAPLAYQLDSDNSFARRSPWVTSHDIDEARHILQARAWSWSDVMRNLKMTDGTTSHATYEWQRDWPDVTPVKGLQRAYLVKVAVDLVPRPLPPNVVVVDSTKDAVTLLAFTCSWIDWGSFRACLKDSPDAPEHCENTALPARADMRAEFWPRAPGLPDQDLRNLSGRILTLHFPLKPQAACPDEAVWMPNNEEVWQELRPANCPGAILTRDGAPAGTNGSLTMHSSAPPSELVVQWPVGSPECAMAYRGVPPFFAEGDPVTVGFLRTLLTTREKHQ